MGFRRFLSKIFAVKMENQRYEAYRIYRMPFGRLYIPEINPHIKPDSIIPLIIGEKKRKREIEDRKPFSPEIKEGPSRMQ